MDPSLGEQEDPSPRFANLQRAAQYPWTDDGHCVAREARVIQRMAHRASCRSVHILGHAAVSVEAMSSSFGRSHVCSGRARA